MLENESRITVSQKYSCLFYVFIQQIHVRICERGVYCDLNLRILCLEKIQIVFLNAKTMFCSYLKFLIRNIHTHFQKFPLPPLYLQESSKELLIA